MTLHESMMWRVVIACIILSCACAWWLWRKLIRPLFKNWRPKR